MSLAIREIVADYHAELSARPDGQVHVMDVNRITHRIVFTTMNNARVDCNHVYVHSHLNPTRLAMGNGPDVIPTWNDVDCMTCITKEKP